MDNSSRSSHARRLLVLMIGMLLTGLMATAPALAQTTDVTADLTSTDVTSTDVTADLTSTDVTADLTSTDVTADLTSTDLTADLTSTTTGSTTPTAPSGSNTVIQYSPYPYPVFGDYGHRYYGKYYDNGCGCDRYAAPTYTPQTVVATQVASVPKGGVDTGDGSFQ